MGKYAQNIMMSVQSKYSLYCYFWLKIFSKSKTQRLVGFSTPFFWFCVRIFWSLGKIVAAGGWQGHMVVTELNVGTTMGSTLRTLDNAPLVVFIFSKRQKTSHPRLRFVFAHFTHCTQWRLNIANFTHYTHYIQWRLNIADFRDSILHRLWKYTLVNTWAHCTSKMTYSHITVYSTLYIARYLERVELYTKCGPSTSFSFFSSNFSRQMLLSLFSGTSAKPPMETHELFTRTTVHIKLKTHEI